MLQYDYEIVLLGRAADINSMNVGPDVLVLCGFLVASNEGEGKLPVVMEPSPGVPSHISLQFHSLT